MAFVNVVKPADTRPLSQYSKTNKAAGSAFAQFMSVLESGVSSPPPPLQASMSNDEECQMVRDNFTTSTWLSIGACIQGILLLCIPSRLLALLPAFLVLLFRICDVLLMMAGLKHNSYMDGVMNGKYSAQIPDAKGKFSAEPADAEVCVMILGVRSNHPLGMLAPGYSEIADYFKKMAEELEAKPEEYGFLGISSWLNFGDRDASNEIMTVSYFRSAAHLHHFARGPSHRAGWDWWNKMVKKYSYMGIMHEIYSVPKQRWENVYINYHPTGLSATTHRAQNEGGKDTWISPIVDSRKGRLRSSAGRMGTGHGDENEAVAEDPYA